MKQPLGCMFTKRAPNRGGVGCAGVGCGESFGVGWGGSYRGGVGCKILFTQLVSII